MGRGSEDAAADARAPGEGQRAYAKHRRRLSRHSALGDADALGHALDEAAAELQRKASLQADRAPAEPAADPAADPADRRRELLAQLEALPAPAAPAAVGDLLQLVRKFRTQLKQVMTASPAPGAAIRRHFDEELAAAYGALSFDAVFSLENVKKAVRCSDGFRPHLMSPEAALRHLITEALQLLKAPSAASVDTVMDLLLGACNAAVDALAAAWPKAYPRLEVKLKEVCLDVLVEWTRETKATVVSLLQMEHESPSYKYFRTVANRRAASVLGDAGLGGGGARASKEYLMGFLEKRDYARQRWQRRWFVLSQCKRQLYYFKRPDDAAPRGVLDLADSVLITDVKTPRVLKDGTTDTRLVFRFAHHDAERAVLPMKRGKEYKTFTVRAPNKESKAEWMEALHKVCRKQKKVSIIPQEELVEEERMPSPRTLPALPSLMDDDAFGAPDYDSDGEPDLQQADEGEIQSIAAISAPLNGCAMEDGRTLHLVLPSFNVARNAAGVDDLTLNYLDQIAGDTYGYCASVSQTLQLSIPKAIIYLLVKRVEDELEDRVLEALLQQPSDAVARLLDSEDDHAAAAERRQLETELAELEQGLLGTHAVAD